MADTDDVRRRMRAGALAGLKIIANDLAGRAQRRAPIEEGTLRASATVDIADSSRGVEATVSFNTPYAQRQHEETGWRHPRGGEPKYLEGPLKEMAARYETVLGAAIKRALGA